MSKLQSCSVVVVLLAVTLHLTCANRASEGTISSEKFIRGAAPAPPSTSLGNLYRSARDDYNARRHCSNCGPGYERDMRTYGRPGVVGYYSGMGPIEDDRNWYYRPEVFEDRVRGVGGYQPTYSGGYRQPGYMMMGYEYDRYMQNRPGDRGYGYGYPGMAMGAGYGYDGGNGRMSHYPEMMRGHGYRGNGYDNLDPQYEYYMTQRGAGGGVGMTNRDRYHGSQGYYEDRLSYAGQYDQKNFRPWDQTYSGISGFDNSGRGYYFASRPSTSSSSSSPPLPSSPPYSAHASYHVQAQPAVAPPAYASQVGSGYEPAHHSSQPSVGGYRSEHQHQNGPDRPDYQPPSDYAPNCCRNRYQESASHTTAVGNAGATYHGPTGMSSMGYGGGGSGIAHRPSSSSGTWSYLGSGPTVLPVGQHHASGSGGSISSSSSASSTNGSPNGSYGDRHSGPGHYPGADGASGQQSYGGNRGVEHHREADHRQQSTVYGGRPRPSSLGDTSYLMDRGSSDSNHVSPEPVSKTTDDDDSAIRAKPDNSYDQSKESSARNTESNAQNNEPSA